MYIIGRKQLFEKNKKNIFIEQVHRAERSKGRASNTYLLKRYTPPPNSGYSQ